MQIQLLSDLHLEAKRRGAEPYMYDLPVCAEHLALLGDTGCTTHEQLFYWLKRQLCSFRIVFYLSGNNEPSHSTISDSNARLHAFSDEVRADSSIRGEFVYLNKTRYDLSPTVTILGCTLWAGLNSDDLYDLSWLLLDFRRIHEFHPPAYTTLHREHVAWLNAVVEDITTKEPERTIVIFTHHAPTIKGTSNPTFSGKPTNCAFATELSGEPCWMSRKVKVWAFGHTHWSCDFEHNGVRVYSNQRGYGEGGNGYDKTKVLEIV